MTARKKNLQYPTKTTLNLALKDYTMNSPRNVLPIFLVLLVVIGAFTKFAVIDRLAEVSAARAGLADAQTRLLAAETANADYASLAAEYDIYTYNGLTEEETKAVDRMEALDLLEQQLMAAARVSVVSVSGNIMSARISGVTLQGLSELMRDLNTHSMVSGVSVSTAGTQSGEAAGDMLAAVTITITLVQAEKGGDGQ